ncbi:methionine-synthesizing 5- methyltetrahydropteroyltriglutamate--homocysteine methyltransferase [Hypoxylon texense]
MSLLCCFRSRQTTCGEPDQGPVELPTHPPAATLPKSPPPTSEADLPSLSSPPIVVTQPPSFLHNQISEATVDPTILEVDDSDDDEPVRSTLNSSTGTLEAIRTKFIRRLSEGSGSKRHSQQSLGTSDEEIARRAELKRLMHKRIQEELKSEEEQDEEAVTRMSTIDELRAVGSCAELPSGGPRDNIEFSVSDVSETGSKDCINGSLDAVLLALPSSGSQPAVFLRRSSYSSLTSASQSAQDRIPENPGTLKERASLPQLPSSPHLAPVHLPSIRSSESICSWRLSYSAERVASYLGDHGESNPVIDSENVETRTQNEEIKDQIEEREGPVDGRPSDDQASGTNIEPTETSCQQQPSSNHDPQHDQSNIEASEDLCAENSQDTDSGMDSPLDLWLRSQELQSNSAVSSRRTSDMILQMIPDSFDSRLCQAGDIDESALLGGVRNVSSTSSAAPHSPLGAWSTSRSPQADAEMSLAKLPSAEPEEQPQSIGDPSGLISPSRSTDAEKSRSDVSSYKTAHNEASASDITPSEIRTQQHPIDETGSTAVSDTASFKHREAELKSIEKRFGHSQARRDITTPVVSKFREEFTEFRVSATTKNSIFTKFHLPLPKRAKNPAKDIRGYSMRDAKSRSVDNLGSATSHVLQKDSMKVIIDKLPLTSPNSDHGPLVVERESSQRQHIIGHGDVSDSQNHKRNSLKDQQCQENAETNHDTHISTLEGETCDREQTISSQKVVCVTSVLDPQSRVEYGQTLKPPSRPEDGGSPSQQSDISNSVLREWVNLMNDEGSQAHVEPRSELQNRSPLRFKTPPASWAKWPSHTRLERNGPAGERDDMISKDFTVRAGSNGSGTTWSTDKPNDSPKRYITPESRSLSAQVGKVVKGGLDKVVQGTLNRDRRASAESDRGRQKSYGHLEYPELEILPMNGGYKELQALEKQIDSMKRGSVIAEGQFALSSSDSTRPPLSARLASEVHMIQHKISKASCRDDQDAVAIPPATLPVTPRQVLPAPEGAPKGNDHAETPESQVSYEDCVPKHMLEDEGSVDDGAIAEHGHTARAA